MDETYLTCDNANRTLRRKCPRERAATERRRSDFPSPIHQIRCFMTLSNVGMVRMGEAKRRRAARQPPASTGLSFAEIDRMGEDPDDRAIREAHGFAYEDDF